MRCVINEGCATELLERIRDDMYKTVSHVYTKRVQAEDFKDERECGVRVLQMDFAMNYTCEYENEVQSALWSRESVMLFTAAIILNGQVDTYIICSDSNDKGSKYTVLALIAHLYDHILKEGPQADGEVICTDGTSHGKGIVVGVGGRAKSIVKADAPVVQSSSDLAGKLLEKTTVFHISQRQINDNNNNIYI